MSSLYLLTTCEQGIPFTSLLLMVDQHVQEDLFTIPKPKSQQPDAVDPKQKLASPSPPTKPAANTSPPKYTDTVVNSSNNVSATPAAPSSTSNTQHTVVAPLSEVDVNTNGGGPPQPSAPPTTTARSVGGFVAPPSPYTAFRKPHMRRPNSASLQRGTVNSSGMDSLLTNAPPPPPTQPGHEGPSPAEGEGYRARRLEYVDRWLEKLYFRNPIIVSKSRPSSPMPSAHPQPPTTTTTAPIGASSSSNANTNHNKNRNPSTPHQNGNHAASPVAKKPPTIEETEEADQTSGDERVVAMLPPKPATRNPEVWREVLQEKLVSCFDIAGTWQEGDSGRGRPPLRASSARPGSATSRQGASPIPSSSKVVCAQQISPQQPERVDASLPNVSKFVTKKRMMAS